jgi:hypothetical protein
MGEACERLLFALTKFDCYVVMTGDCAVCTLGTGDSPCTLGTVGSSGTLET